MGRHRDGPVVDVDIGGGCSGADRRRPRLHRTGARPSSRRSGRGGSGGRRGGRGRRRAGIRDGRGRIRRSGRRGRSAAKCREDRRCVGPTDPRRRSKRIAGICPASDQRCTERVGRTRPRRRDIAGGCLSGEAADAARPGAVGDPAFRRGEGKSGPGTPNTRTGRGRRPARGRRAQQPQPRLPGRARLARRA